MSRLINSALGPISTRDLGITLIHEHFTWGHCQWKHDATEREKFTCNCVDMVREAQKYGLKTIVDATPIDGERDPDLYKAVADRTGLNIICATGLYYEGGRYPEKSRIASSSARRQVLNEYCEHFVSDITQGIGDSDVRAGVIKLATGKDAITPFEELAFEAAVMAQKETGAPIITHTESGTMGPRQADLLASMGADPKRLAIGHMCGNTDVNYQREVLGKGPYVSFDRFGVDILLPDADRIKTAVSLIKSGYEKQLLFSHDCVLNWICRQSPGGGSALPQMANWNLWHIFKNILPTLKKAGISDHQISTIMADNPRRFFTGE